MISLTPKWSSAERSDDNLVITVAATGLRMTDITVADAGPLVSKNLAAAGTPSISPSVW